MQMLLPNFDKYKKENKSTNQKKKKKKFAGVFCVSMAHNVDFTWE